MRRQFAAVLCGVVLLLAGCQGFDTGQPTANETNGTATADEVVTLTVNNVSNETESVSLTNDSDGTTPTGTDDGAPESESVLGGGEFDDADPEIDRLGWEGGYWHNESLSITESDGLNESEQAALVNRSMARVEYIRGLEFNTTVPVDVISREEYQSGSGGSYGESLRTFDNAKFEALFLIGESEDSIATQDSTLGASVLGYYSPAQDQIVIVSDTETPTISENTLGHELVHALQDQRFDLDATARTRDGVQGRNGLVEGDASAVDAVYSERCGVEWECLTPTSGGGGGGGDTHAGISFLYYFPYSDGAAFVSDLRDRGGWSAVDDAYADPPDGAREVITSEDYPEWEPRNVTLPEAPGDEWEQVRPSTDRNRPDYGTPGPSAIAATMAYTRADQYNSSYGSSVVTADEILNYDGATLDATDPYNYDLAATDGWEGGRMEVYENGSETGYVWRTVWADEREAETFAEAWGDVVEHWGGSRNANGTYVIDEASPFTDAIAIHVEGDTVTVVNAPTAAELTELYDA